MQKYLTIYHELVNRIETDYWPESTMLPSENELATKYDTSRETIRKSLDLLVQNGYIQKIRGKGSVVISKAKFNFPVSGIVSFKELASEMQEPVKTLVKELALMEPEESVQKDLEISAKEKVWKVVRVREISGEKIILDKDYFNPHYVPDLTTEIAADSIYDYLEHELGLKISFARKEIVVEQPTEADRKYLDLNGFSNVVVIKSKVYLEDTSLFQYTESRHRPDKFRFVEFARRVHN